MNKRRKTVVAYLRMSTDKQVDSTATQMDAITRWAEQEGLVIASVHKDSATSGTLSPKRRPGLLDALRSIEENKSAALVVYDDSRLARNMNGAGWVETELEELGAVLIDVSDPDMPRLNKVFTRFQNEEYVADLKRRTRDALRRKGRNQERISGQLPYGFQLASDGHHIEPCAAEQKTLARMVALRKEGLGGRRIAAALMAEGFQPRGKAWHPISVQKMADAAIQVGRLT